jgi:hypothetical protein
MEFDPRTVKGDVAPLIDRISVRVIERVIEEFLTQNLVVIYRVNDRDYLQVINWSKHQSVNHPKPSIYPPPPAETLDSRNDTGRVRDAYGKATGIIPIGTGNREQGTGNREKTPIVPFARFWKPWPKKVKKSEAEKVWNKLNPDEELVRKILAAVEHQKKPGGCLSVNEKYIPYPTTWLNGRRWEDEDIISKEGASNDDAWADWPDGKVHRLNVS